MLFRRRPIQVRTAHAPMSPWLHHVRLILVLTLLISATAFVGLLHSDLRELTRRAIVLHLRDATKRRVSLGQVVFSRHGHVQLIDLEIFDHPGSPHPLFTASRIDLWINLQRLTATPFHPVGSISQVAVDHPVISVARDAHGKWNFEDILTKPSGPSHDHFRGSVQIKHGELWFDDASELLVGSGPTHEHLVNLTGRMAAGSDNMMPFRLTARSTTGHLRNFVMTGGYDAHHQRTIGETRFAAVDAGFIGRLFRHKLPQGLRLDSGHADGRLQLLIARDPKHPKEFGVTETILADVHDVHGQLHLTRCAPAPFTMTDGQFRMSDGVVELADMHGEFGGVPAAFSGTISHFASPGPICAIQIQVKDANTVKLVRLIPGLSTLPYRWGGQTDAWIQLTGRIVDPQVAGHITGPTFAGNEMGEFHHIESDIRVSTNASTVELSNLSADGFGGKVTGHAWLSTNSKAAALAFFQGQATNVDAGAVMAQYVHESEKGGAPYSLNGLHGKISGPVTVSVKQGTPRSGQLVAVMADCHGEAMTLQPDAKGLKPLQLGTVDAGVRLDAEEKTRIVHTRIAQAIAQSPDALFHVQGEVDAVGETTTMHLDLQGSRLNLAAIERYFPNTTSSPPCAIDGHGYLVGTVTGRITNATERVDFAGQLQAQRGSIDGHSFTDFSGNVQASLSPTLRLTLQQGHLISQNSQVYIPRLAAAYSGNESAPWRVDGTISLPRTTMADLGAATGYRLPFQGFAEGEVNFTDLLNHPVGTGKLLLLNPSLQCGNATVNFDRAALSFALHENTATLTSAKLFYQDDEIDAFGALRTDSGQFALRVDAPGIDLDNLTTIVPGNDPAIGQLTPDAHVRLPLDVQGQIAMHAHITGTLPAQRADAEHARNWMKTVNADFSIDAGSSLAIAGIPFRQLAAEAEYHGDDDSLTLSRFALAHDNTPKNYQVTLRNATTNSIQLGNQQVALHFDLVGADLEKLRQDMIKVAVSAGKDSPFVPLQQAAESIPQPFDGTGRCTINLNGALAHPVVHLTDLSVTKLTMGDNAMPDLEGSLSYDSNPAKRLVTIDQLTAHATTDSADPNAMAELSGTVTLPLKDARGKEIEPGPIHLNLSAQNITPNLFAVWVRRTKLPKLDGEITVDAQIGETTANPYVRASVDMVNPKVEGVGFDLLSATVTLENSRLLIGRPGSGDAKNGITALLQFRGADKAPIKPLEISGELPFRWNGPLQPDIPLDQPFSLTLNLPKQDLDLLRVYSTDLTPKIPFPTGRGDVMASLKVGGTLAQPRIDDGAFRLNAKELTLEQPIKGCEDLPNHLNDVAVDLNFHSEMREKHLENVIQVNDFSATFDHQQPSGKPSTLLERAKAVLGIKWSKKPTNTGSLVAAGTILIDPQRLAPAGHYVAFDKIPDLLEYDLRVQTITGGLCWQELVNNGSLVAFIHLWNPSAGAKPVVNGIVYLENAKLQMNGQDTGSSSLANLPFHPNLSIALQAGPGNDLKFGMGNSVLSQPLSADLPFAPTTTSTSATPLFSPLALSGADSLFVKEIPGAKPPIEQRNIAYSYTGETLAGANSSYTGTYGSITGTLTQPKIAVNYELPPNRARMQFPMGFLTFNYGKGSMTLASGHPPIIYTDAKATGTLDQYQISATTDPQQNLLALMTPEQLSPDTVVTSPIKFETVSSPTGSMPLSDTDIYQRLLGLNFLAGLVGSNRQMELTNAPYQIGPVWLNSMLNRWAQEIGLNTFDVTFPERYPEASFTTPEFGTTRWSAFSFGASRDFSTVPNWKAWMNYRVPEAPLLKDLMLNTQVDNLNNVDINLQYKLPFSTGTNRKSPPPAPAVKPAAKPASKPADATPPAPATKPTDTAPPAPVAKPTETNGSGKQPL